jgi:peptidoglycan/LPS O-acetylase OafA/YrhL
VTVSATSTEVPPAPEPPSPPRRQWFRGDVDGLRAIAILLVVAYHVGMPGFGGGFIGVDVFFVISGFLISRNLLREAQGHERVALASFWARRIRRLVPALALMIVATLVVGYFVFPLYEMSDFARQGAAAALYVSNIKFAGQAQSYFGGDINSSPFVHTWSLGVEEQFYLLWPVLFALVCWTARRPLSRRIRNYRRQALIAVFAVTFVVSLGIDLVLTNSGSTWAFYGLQSRAWEFAAAGLLAAIPVPAALRAVGARTVLAVSGLVVLVVGLVLIRGTTPYPGLWALLPVVATMALITAGHTWEGEVAANPISAGLTNGSAQWLGRVSYSWYLWHWPAIVLAAAAFNSNNLGLESVAALWALGVAWLAYHYYETPIRFQPILTRSNTRTFVFGAVVTALVLAVAFAVTPSTPTVPAASGGARTVANLQAPPGSSLQQQINVAISLYRTRESVPCPYLTQAESPDGDKYCVGGDAASSKTLMLIGDSHMGQWAPVFEQLATAQHLRLVLREHDGCPPFELNVTDPVKKQRKTAICHIEAAGDLRLLKVIHPAYVLVANWNGYLGNVLGASAQPVPLDQQIKIWQQATGTFFKAVEASGAKAGYIYDEPTLPVDASKCMASVNAVAPCVPTRAQALAKSEPLLQAERRAIDQVGHVSTLDMTDVVCGPHVCPLQVGNTLVYVDTHHLTDAFVATHEPSAADLLSQVRGS